MTERESELNKRIDEHRRQVDAQILENRNQISRVRDQMRDVAVGDVNVQLTGLAMVILGTILAAMG